MFVFEYDMALELLEAYQSSIIEDELYFEEWMAGTYKRLVPRISLQLDAAKRFTKYMSHVIENDLLDNYSRDNAASSTRSAEKRKLAERYRAFNNITRTVALHLIEQARGLEIDADDLEIGYWHEENYFNFLSLTRVMGTLSILCNEVLESYYSKNASYVEAKREWLDMFVFSHGGTREDLFLRDEAGDLYPPQWTLDMG